MTVEEITIVKETLITLIETTFEQNKVSADVGVMILEAASSHIKDKAIAGISLHIIDMQNQLREIALRNEEMAKEAEERNEPDIPVEEPQIEGIEV